MICVSGGYKLNETVDLVVLNYQSNRDQEATGLSDTETILLFFSFIQAKQIWDRMLS